MICLQIQCVGVRIGWCCFGELAEKSELQMFRDGPGDDILRLENMAPQQNLWVAEVGLRQMIRSVLSG